jgi:hypothetical protein
VLNYKIKVKSGEKLQIPSYGRKEPYGTHQEFQTIEINTT